jgi:hypothetical protein
MRGWIGWWGLSVMLVVLSGCDFEQLTDPGPVTNGPVCYTDADCVPSGCCGEGMGAVHYTEASSCAGVQCSGACPSHRAQCGCAIPICRNSHCDIAVTDCG